MSEILARHVLEHEPETLTTLTPVLVEAIERVLYDDPPAFTPGE